MHILFGIKKKYVTISVIFFVFTVVCLSACTGLEKKTPTESEFNNSVYDDFLKTSSKFEFVDTSVLPYEWSNYFYDIDNMFYNFIDINNDDNNELILYNSNKNLSCVYYYKDGEVLPLLGCDKITGWYIGETKNESIICTVDDERTNYKIYSYYLCKGSNIELLFSKGERCESNEYDEDVRFDYCEGSVVQEDVDSSNKKISFDEFKSSIDELVKDKKFYSFDINNMGLLKKDYDANQIEIESLTDEKEKKKMEAMMVVDSYMSFYKTNFKRIGYEYADLDGDSVEELCITYADNHNVPVDIYKKIENKWKYMGCFGQAGGFNYVPSENFLSDEFGNQGVFTTVVLSLTENGFEKVSAHLAYQSPLSTDLNASYYYFKDVDIGNVIKGYTLDSPRNYKKDLQCTKEEYDEYCNSIYVGDIETNGMERIEYDNMEMLYK